MQELQNENARLHRLLDVFDSQPDYMFCCTRDGRVTFLSSRLMLAIGASCPEEVSHVSNLMKQESADALYDYINHLNKSYSQTLGMNSMGIDSHQHRDDLVKEVFLFDGDSSSKSAARNGHDGPQYIQGYMRASRIVRKEPQLVDMETIYSADSCPRSSQPSEATRTGNRSSTTVVSGSVSPAKRQRRDKDKDTYASAKSLEDAAAVLSALTGMANGTIGRSDTVDSTEDKPGDPSVQAMTSTFVSSTELYSNESSPRAPGGEGGGFTLTEREPQSASTSASASLNNLNEVVSGERAISGRRRAAANARGTVSSQHSGSNDGMDDNGSVSAPMDLGVGASLVPLHEEEYVVIIRPVDVSVAYTTLGTRAPITSLSKATMVKHNKQQKDGDAVGSRKRSQSGSSSSGSGGSGDGFDINSNSSSSGDIKSGVTSKQSTSGGSNGDSRSNSEDGIIDTNSSNDNDEADPDAR